MNIQRNNTQLINSLNQLHNLKYWCLKSTKNKVSFGFIFNRVSTQYQKHKNEHS
jgi:hypothetical protein